MPILLDLFLTFLKIGVTSFGGGYGMISILTEEVISHGYLTSEEVLNIIAVSESTPGPIAINMATFVGSSQAGILGALVATLGVILPAFIIILLVASIMKNLLKYKGIQAVLKGVRPVVVGLILATGAYLLFSVVLGAKNVKENISFDYKSIIIFAIIAIIYFVFKALRKKKISSIFLIIISAVLGIIFYGFF